VSELKSHKDYREEKPGKGTPYQVLLKAKEIGGKWGVDEELWEREWSHLSGGEAQRIALAVALALDTAEVLLIDGEHLISGPDSDDSSVLGIRTNLSIGPTLFFHG
jgi:ABC-type dipeptide/oligopeptide/nickel transport system ATPase subunit